MEQQRVSCDVCGNIQESTEKCQCCGNTSLTLVKELSKEKPSTKEGIKKKVVIIGGGIASLSVIRQLIKHDQCQITLVTKEDRLPYYRTTIPKIIHDPSFVSKPQFFLEKTEFYEQNRVELLMNCEVLSVDVEKKEVLFRQNEREGTRKYDDLVFATGAHPNKPPFIPSVQKDNIIPIHSVNDIEQIVTCFNRYPIHHVVIVGAGLSGIEIAAELRRKYTTLQITMLEVADRILPRQLTTEASAVFTKALISHNISLRTSCCVSSLQETETGQLEVKTTNETIHCDLVCYSCGIHSNTTLAQSIGCRCNRGIIVDDHMKTSLPSIYACGDCCEHNGQCYGNWTDAMKQGVVCANTILSRTDTFIHTPMPYFVYCFIGVYSVGTLTSQFTLHQTDSNFMQLFFDETKTKLVGGILIGKIISKIQRSLVKAIQHELSGNDLSLLLSEWSQLLL